MIYIYVQVGLASISFTDFTDRKRIKKFDVVVYQT